MGSSAGLILAASFAIAQVGSAQFVPLPPVEQVSALDATDFANAGNLDASDAMMKGAETHQNRAIDGAVVLPGRMMEVPTSFQARALALIGWPAEDRTALDR